MWCGQSPSRPSLVHHLLFSILATGAHGRGGWRLRNEPLPDEIKDPMPYFFGVKDVAVGAPTETSVSPALDVTEVEAPAVKVVASRKRISVAAKKQGRKNFLRGAWPVPAHAGAVIGAGRGSKL